MTGFSAWRRRVGTFMVAWALAFMVALPTIDAAICGGEGASAAHADAALSDGHADAVHVDASHPDDGGDRCAHGHCHHAAPYVAAATLVLASMAPPVERHPLIRTPVPSADPRFGLERPPRA